MVTFPDEAHRPRYLCLALGLICLGGMIYSILSFHINLFAFFALLLLWLMLHVCLQKRWVDIAGVFIVVGGWFIVVLAQYMVDTVPITLRKGNMYQITQAIQTWSAEKGHLPQFAIKDREGKPLLSWRVAIFPALGYEALYHQFHLDESWDSPHNLRLLPLIPSQYQPVERLEYDHISGRSIISRRTKIGLTHIVALRGQGSAFDASPPVPVKLAHPGLLLLAEGGELTPWTKPADIVVMENDPLPWLEAYSSGRGYTVLGYFNSHPQNCSDHYPLPYTSSKELLQLVKVKNK